MTREDFLKKVMRYILMLILGLTAFVLGKKAAYGADCSACPQSSGCDKVKCSIITP